MDENSKYSCNQAENHAEKAKQCKLDSYSMNDGSGIAFQMRNDFHRNEINR